MLIADLALDADIRVLGDPQVPVTGVSLDSRSVEPGFLYAALPGANVHGAQFAAQLIARGTRAILTDPPGLEMIRQAAPQTGETTAYLVAENPRAHLGAIAAQIYGTDPAHPVLLGITGTNGKTTTAYMLNGLLTALGRTTGVIGTIATLIAGTEQPSVRTTPEAPELHALLARMRAAGVDSCAMEVSSHALAQHRVDGARFRVAGFTNLTQDHLDFHGTMEEYFRTKAQLFTPAFSDSGVIVLADHWCRRLAAEAEVPVVTISTDPGDAPDWLVTMQDLGRFTLAGPAGVQLAGTSPLPGDFNVMNTALALVMLERAGTSPADLARCAGSFEAPVPGRMEVINPADPRAIVDYSHTPDAIEQVLAGLDEGTGPLVIVFGAGGDRDRGKRRAMGRAAAREADVVIITDDNPRSEDPAEIRAAVLAGIRDAIADGSARTRAASVLEIGSRSEAIRTGIDLAGSGGTVVIAGKGHETGQEIAGVKHHFDDREQTRSALASRGSHTGPGRVQD
ncbi:UDP-N-acetylmuramoyl-L-alanyl-D-glutamate--2,6-diaminopimelate ligase [Brevibacterium daeguense]|uniref:UDP-N-acetylmuramoyl-L-alanyl-D-glutamate--2,6-diaminopimelate ligase n=1 Tax=Brevibacterium daeguense TaxID=909936 RepID=A0ABP8EMX1_9MICO|nr:UDP-N-acetylmuramoyl-L-alanyl-D-glutamate--2,6-diaminopimelate ligase [Brevibacterium daeguense]